MTDLLDIGIKLGAAELEQVYNWSYAFLKMQLLMDCPCHPPGPFMDARRMEGVPVMLLTVCR